MKFLEVAEVFNEIEQVSSRNEITRIVGEFYRTLNENEAQIFSYLLLGRVGPLFIPAEYNFSEKSLLNLMNSKLASLEINEDIYKVRAENGDIGTTASYFNELIGSNSQSEPLEASDVYDGLWQLVLTTGKGAVAAKAEIAQNYLNRMSPTEAKFYSRIVVGKLRFGASDKTVLDALSYMVAGDKSLSERLKAIYGKVSDLGYVATIAKKWGEKLPDEDDISATPGVPLFSRLVERVKDFDEAVERMGEKFYVQPKFDGLRCQAHKGVDYGSGVFEGRVWASYMAKLSEQNSNTEMQLDFSVSSENPKTGVKLYSRSLEELTDMFPEVCETLASFKSKDFILDGEVIGWDEKIEGFAPFQVTITRKRKFGIEQAVTEVPVRYYVFDLLYWNGEDLTDLSFGERFIKMQQFFEENRDSLQNMIFMTDTPEITSKDELLSEFEDAAVQGLEGLIAKQVQGGYQPGIRNYEWIKLKKSMDKKLVDTVDVVIMGYYFGSGKRSAFGIGGLLAGIYNAETGNVESITKIGTGINDAQFVEIKNRLDSIKVDKKPSNYLVNKVLEADVWVAPEVICSVEADEVTKSSMHFAGRGEGEQGIALRFPRLIEFDRDKRLEDTTSVNEILKIA